MRARLLVVLLAPLAGLEAQTPRPAVRTATPARPPMGGACASLTSVPSELVRTPEGMALLRFKKELEGVATVFVQRDTALRSEARRMFEVQRGVDSLMQVFVRFRTGDTAQSSTVTLRRGDSTMVLNQVIEGRVVGDQIEGAIKAMRPNVEVALRSVEPHLQMMTTRGARVVSTASATGYMGINLSGSQIRMVSDSGSFTAHCDYPMIEAVDVGSPARQADLRAGDTIVAYNGRDLVAQTVNYPQLLVPGKVVRVRVRRDGRAREVPVTVAARPQEPAEAVFRFTPVPGGFLTPVPPRPSAGGVMVRSVPSATPAPSPPLPPSPRLVAGNAMMINVLGAQLNAVDHEFAQTLGVEPGILVMRVIVGSPAGDAGLRAGELIQAVNGTPARELVQVQRAINAPGAKDVKLTVTARDTPTRIVTVRW